MFFLESILSSCKLCGRAAWYGASCACHCTISTSAPVATITKGMLFRSSATGAPFGQFDQDPARLEPTRVLRSD